MDPLPKKFEDNFTTPSKTGFAWVNKSWNKWSYNRNINKKPISITSENINELFEEVCKNKLTWGVRDENKALKSLNMNKDVSSEQNPDIPQNIPEKYKYILNLLPENYKDILKPLDNKFKDNFNTPSKTGFAWVEKPNFIWTFSRGIDGDQKYLSNENIFILYDEIMENNFGWGVRDYDKAVSVIKNELNKIPSIKSPQKPKNDMLITYLSRDGNNINIMIKGLIKENELFSYLSNLKEFEHSITRILTNKFNNKIDILIELDLDKNLLFSFENKMKKLR